MTIRIRPHHLLCMLTFVGRGYSPQFVSNLERIARRIASGNETVQIILGPDDVCEPLLADSECHCRGASVSERDRLAIEALSDLLAQPVCENETLRLDSTTLTRLRAAFAAGTIRKACEGCQWVPLCDEIAKNGFSGTVLFCGDPTQR
ncbi:MAG TPA: DUF1284 domain-containing protein [Silvibacterium sp.]|nr:DUF1284 domain-containing protein [Silvibacterium sp.]